MSHMHQSHASRGHTLPFLGLAQAIVRRFHERREMRALLNMDDYMLHDIGISRGDVQCRATRSVWWG